MYNAGVEKRLFTVVFVEDEYLTREEIVRTTDWTGLGLSLIGTADNGIDGEKMILELQPDIVITDIRLPGQDGLKMLEHCDVNSAVILSGHTDYQYMKRAIRLGVMDYLQKPVDDDEFETTLKAVVSKLDDENKEIETIRKGMEMDAEIGEMTIQLPAKVGNLQVDATIDFIMRNFSKPVGLAEAAEAVNLSESHLSRLFKEVTGINFLQYLNAKRINNAISSLRNPRLNVSDISLECGFPNPGYFSKMFKKYTGRTPSQFRDGLPEK